MKKQEVSSFKNVCLIVSSLLLLACEPEEVPAEMDKINSAGQSMVSDEISGEMRTEEIMAGDSSPSEGEEICTPAEEEWSNVKQIFGEKCGLCHGTAPQFGAPFALSTYEDVTGERQASIAQVLSNGTMPPAGQSMLTADERMLLSSWLNCGEIGTPPDQLPAGGFSSTRPILSDPGIIPENVDFFELRADNFQVPTNRSDRYECFTIEAPTSEPRFIKRIETIVGDARVLHHVVVIPESGGREPGTHSSCDQDNAFAMIYGWAPGQGALHFAEGGIKLEPGQALTLQIHYNNSARYDDAIDDSGVRIYHGAVEGPEVAVLSLGPVGFEVAPRSREEVTGYCELPTDTKIIASFPHMHEMGASFKQVVTRDWIGQNIDQDPVWEDVITLDGWDFESQYVYDSPMNLQRGDLIKTSCMFENTTEEVLKFGEKTSDEMCFNFAYISPPIGLSLCNQSTEPSRSYQAGVCAPPESESWSPPAVEVTFEAGDQQILSESSPLSPGLYWIDQAIATVPNEIVEQYRFDLNQSGARGRGAVVWGEDNSVMMDLNSEMRLVALGLSFTENFNLSFQSNLMLHVANEEPDLANGSFDLEMTCGSFEQGQMWVNPDSPTISGERTSGGWIEFPVKFGPFELVIRAHLSRAENQ